MRWLKLFSLAALGVGCALSSALAAPIAVEEFDYGASSTALNGLGSAGNGFSGGWTVTGTDWTYNPTSLTFSDLSATGGSVTGISSLGATIGRRTFTTTLPASSVYWGSFLSRVESQTVDNFWSTSVFVGQPTDGLGSETFVFKSKSYGVAVPSVGVESANSDMQQAVVVGTTYLNLIKADPASSTITGWSLTAAQYDNFKAGGITEAELNGAATGTGASEVFGRTTRTSSNTLDPATTLSLWNIRNSGQGTGTFDRIYFSGDSLDAAISPAAVPEPSTWALLALGSAGLLGWSRRKR